MNYLLILAGIVVYMFIGAIFAILMQEAVEDDDEALSVAIVLGWPLFLICVVAIGAPTLTLRAVDSTIDWYRARKIVNPKLPHARTRRR